MTFKDEVDAAGERYWKNAYEDRMTDVLDTCVDKIDELERDLDNVRAATTSTDERFDKLESELVNLLLRMDSVEFVNSDAKIKLSAPATSEPFLGYNDLIKEVIPVIKATIAEKKRELTHKARPTKVSEN